MKYYYPVSLFVFLLLFLLSHQAYSQVEVQNPTFPFWKLLGNQTTDTAINFVGTTDNRGLTFRTNNIRRMTINTDGNVGIGTVIPDVRLQVNGEVRIGLVNNNVFGSMPNYGNKLFFSGGPSVAGFNSDNTDELSLARYNITSDQSDLRMTIGDNAGPANLDYFSIGTQASAYDLFAVRSDGWVGIGTRTPDSRLDVHGKATISRDGMTECCGNDATLVLAENTAGTGRLSSISFHNSGLAEGGLALVSDNTGLGIASRRLRLFDNQGQAMGLQITGNFFFGNSDSRSQTRDNAGLRGDAGAQSGFYETSNPSNFPAGATSWWHLIDTRHSNIGNNYAMQFSGSFFDQKLFVRKTNNNAAQNWNRIVNSADAAATNGFLMFDVAAVNGTVEGSLDVNIVGGTLTIVGRNEGGAVVGTWYTLNNVANAKIVVLITNDDTNNCGSNPRVSSTRTFNIANGGGLQNQGTDLGCSGSDGNNMTFMVAFNPL